MGKGSYDIILCGAESTDARTSLGRVSAHRETDRGYDVIEGPLPAVIGVVWGANEPRYPSFKGIMASNGKPVETLSAADVGIDVARVGL